MIKLLIPASLEPDELNLKYSSNYITNVALKQSGGTGILVTIRNQSTINLIKKIDRRKTNIIFPLKIRKKSRIELIRF